MLSPLYSGFCISNIATVKILGYIWDIYRRNKVCCSHKSLENIILMCIIKQLFEFCEEWMYMSIIISCVRFSWECFRRISDEKDKIHQNPQHTEYYVSLFFPPSFTSPASPSDPRGKLDSNKKVNLLWHLAEYAGSEITQ